jgi:hypothetical protein
MKNLLIVLALVYMVQAQLTEKISQQDQDTTITRQLPIEYFDSYIEARRYCREMIQNKQMTSWKIFEGHEVENGDDKENL